MLQFWNMFNAKAFMEGSSAFANLKECKSFLFVALLIIIGQYLIVTFGGEMFSVTPLTWKDWGIIIGSTSLVLWFGEIARLIDRLRKA
jgi:Ca2+-transporting ATPase